MLAQGKTAATILDRVKRLSERYGTEVVIEGQTASLSLN
jgi:hypothetical protein